MLQTVRRIAVERGIGVVLVSHKIDEVLAVCDEITVLAGGKVVLHSDVKGLERGAIISAIAGDADHRDNGLREAGAHRREGRRAFPDKVLTVTDLRGPRLSGINLSVGKGEILGVFGLVGSGRTRFLRTVYGMEPMTSGTITLGGRDYAPVDPHDAISKGIAFLTEERKRDGFIPLMSSFQNVAPPVLTRFRVGGAFVDHRAARARAQTTLGRIATRGNLDGPVQSLSGGNQQKVLLGRIIEQDSALILLDEPTKGVDISAKAEIYQIIRNLAAEGRAVIVVSSEEEELLELADNIVIFRQGQSDGVAVPAGDLTIAQLRREAWAHVAA
ncbi:MAG: ATP-binding cassette domain-containing protein [Paracoccaceae bacterium]